MHFYALSLFSDYIILSNRTEYYQSQIDGYYYDNTVMYFGNVYF